MQIRPETPKDYPVIYKLIQTAFQTAKVKDGDEQDFAECLREGENYISELALVAEIDGKLVGHIMLTKTHITQPDGSLYEGLLLAPLAVLLEHRNQKIGAALINKGFEKAKQLNYHSVFLCGDPAYYSHFGFQPIGNFGIKSSQNIPAPYAMVVELKANALTDVTGILAGF